MQSGPNDYIPRNHRACLKAIEKGDIDDVRRLLTAGGVRINPEDVDPEDQPLQIASKEGHLHIVRLLVDNGADVNLPLNNGETALMIAALRGHIGIILYLLEKGARINAQNHSGDSPLHESVFYGNLDVIRILLEHGADRTLINVDGRTPEEEARARNKNSAADAIRDWAPIPLDGQLRAAVARISELEALLAGALQRAATAEQGLAAADTTIKELNSAVHGSFRLLGSVLADTVPMLAPTDVTIDRASILGRGSNGSVFPGMWNGTAVAVKTDFLALTIAESPAQREHAAIGLFRECHALRQLNHRTPHAAHLHGVVVDPETGLPTAIVLEKLRPLPATSEGLSMHQLAQLGVDISAALMAMHERRPVILHRDIKPENILRTENNVYKVTDLSEVKMIRNNVTRFSAVGTRSFGAPEIGDGTQQTGAVDIYSLGMTITEIFLKVKLNCPEGASNAQRQAYNESRVAVVAGMNARLGGFLSRMVAAASEVRPTASDCCGFFKELEALLRPRAT